MRHPTLDPRSGGVDWKTVALQVFTPDEPFFFLIRQTFRRLGVPTIGRLALGATPIAPGGVALIDLVPDPEAGLAAISCLRRASATRPLLVVAPSTLTGPLAEARRLGIDGTVPKPVSGHELTLRVTEVLTQPRPVPVAEPAPLPLPVRPVGAVVPPLAPPPPPPSPPPVVRRWDEADLLPVAVPPALRSGALELADLPPPRPSSSWQDALDSPAAPAPVRTRSGRDLGPVLAEHRLWLDSAGAEGQRLTLSGDDLAGTDLAGALLPKATLRGVDLSDAVLTDARLDGADLRQAVLSAADLCRADLGVATLRHARLDLCRLEGASLRGADLSGASLIGAHLAEADFAGANLTGADLSRTDLSAVKNLIQKQVEKTRCTLETRLPPGLCRPPGSGEG